MAGLVTGEQWGLTEAKWVEGSQQSCPCLLVMHAWASPRPLSSVTLDQGLMLWQAGFGSGRPRHLGPQISPALLGVLQQPRPSCVITCMGSQGFSPRAPCLPSTAQEVLVPPLWSQASLEMFTVCLLYAKEESESSLCRLLSPACPACPLDCHWGPGSLLTAVQTGQAPGSMSPGCLIFLSVFFVTLSEKRC